MFIVFHRAAEANQREIVLLIFEFKADYSLFTTCDGKGRNVFHHAVANPNVLCDLLKQSAKVGVNLSFLIWRYFKRSELCERRECMSRRFSITVPVRYKHALPSLYMEL